jgi:hypothetical protein
MDRPPGVPLPFLVHSRRFLVAAVATACALMLGVGLGLATRQSAPRLSAVAGVDAGGAVGFDSGPPLSAAALTSLTKSIGPAPRKPVPRADGWESSLDNDGAFAPLRALPELPADLSAVLALAGLDLTGEVLDHPRVREIATLLGFGGPTRLDQRTLDEMVTMARRRQAPLLTAAGVNVGFAVDDVDLARAADGLRVSWGEVMDPGDVRRILDEAQAAAAPSLWAATANILTTRPLDLRRLDRVTASPGVDLSRWRAELSGGAAVVHVLRWRLDDPRVGVRALAAGALGGKATVPQMAAHLDRLAQDPASATQPVAVVNGGFWLGSGEPDGLLVQGGEVLSDPTTRRSWIRGQRGAAGIGPDGGIVGRPDWQGDLLVQGQQIELRGVNRGLDLDNDVVAFTPSWGERTGTRPGTVELVIHDVRLAQVTNAVSALAQVHTEGNVEIPVGGIVVAARGARATTLQALAIGTEIRVVATASAGWTNILAGIGGGPLLLQDAQPTSAQQWFDEGFGTAHNLNRHPRTALGFTAWGEAILLVVDGRQPGYSLGMTTAQTIHLLRSFGVTDAVMLDGGGSSHLVVDGITANRPCCDVTPRPVSTVLVIDQRTNVR